MTGIPGKKSYGGTAYHSLIMAIQMFPQYSGYLFVMDDVLLNYWRLRSRPFDRLWAQRITTTMGTVGLE